MSERLRHNPEKIHRILHDVWGYTGFRPLQQEIIESVMAGRDTLALMPTGGGKSLCYQVPALAMDGMCLVISPLIALMKDQVESLRKRNITAYSIFSGMSRKEVMNILKVVTDSNCKFLYVSPERLETSLFREFLPGMGIRLIAVDEAHCISQWGYDFRPPYLRIAAIREELPHVPVLALTASATPEVQRDICIRLSAGTPPEPPGSRDFPSSWNVFRQSFERPNLSYSVFHCDSRISRISEILRKVPGSGIVYCRSRKRTREISDLLSLQGISADYYHAGLSTEERNRRQTDWIENRIRIIVCTNAFGMGIDKPDVRMVIHADLPECLENYYQEAGRAGRDGKNAYAVLLYDTHNLNDLRQLASLRFPSLDQIRQVYQAVANYLQLHTGDGEGKYFDFDLNAFTRNFKISNHTAIYALKALEQDGWLAFNEQVFLPSFIRFTCTKDYLYGFEQAHADLEPMIKTLLRAYEGIFDQPVAVSEKMIAGIMKTETEQVLLQLNKLHQSGIIEYLPQKDTPQVLIMRSRIRAEDLSFNMEAYKLRREQFERRVTQMLQYVEDTDTCRSKAIAAYFGDSGLKDCGICDNCLRKKKDPLSHEEFEHIRQRIMAAVREMPVHTRDLLLRLEGIKKEKAWKVIEFLQTENKIGMDPDGTVRCL